MLSIVVILVVALCVETSSRARKGERCLLKTHILPRLFAARPLISTVTDRMGGLYISGAGGNTKSSCVSKFDGRARSNSRLVSNRSHNLSSVRLDFLSKSDVGNIVRESACLYEIYFNVSEAQRSQPEPLSNDEALKILGLGIKHSIPALIGYFLNVPHFDNERLTELETEKFLDVIVKKIVPQLISRSNDHGQARKIRYIWNIFTNKFHQELKCYYDLDSMPPSTEFIDIERHESVLRKIKSGYYSTPDRTLTSEEVRKILEAATYVFDLQWKSGSSQTQPLFRDGHQFVKEFELPDPLPFANPGGQLTGEEAMFLVNWYFTDIRDELLTIYWNMPNTEVFGCTEEEIRLVINVFARKLLHDFIARGYSSQVYQEELRRLRPYRYRRPS